VVGVRIKTTGNGVVKPGLMQGNDGAHTRNDQNTIQTPWPTSNIYGMIQDVAGGTGSRDGLARFLNKPHAADISAYYKEPVFTILALSLRVWIWGCARRNVVLRVGHCEQVDGLG
jgi:hypothetical protein